MILPSLRLRALSDEQIDNYADEKVKKIVGNVLFPSAQKAIGLAKTALAKYVLLLINKKDLTMIQAKQRETLRAEIENALLTAAYACAVDAYDDLKVYDQSGFAAKKGAVSSKSVANSVPAKFTFSVGNVPGTAILGFAGKGKSYVFAWTPDPISENSVWNVVPSTKTKTTLKDLPKETKVWIKAGILDADNNVTYCDPIKRILQ